MKKLELENYFFDVDTPIHRDKKLVLVIYDICDNKRRSKFIKLLEKYGVRVQKSAFEMIISSSQYNSLVGNIPNYIDGEDNVRVYKLKIDGEVMSWGSALTQAEEVIII